MIEKLKEFGKVLENVSLKKYTTYKIGGDAKCLVHPADKDNFIKLIKFFFI